MKGHFELLYTQGIVGSLQCILVRLYGKSKSQVKRLLILEKTEYSRIEREQKTRKQEKLMLRSNRNE